MKWYWLGPKRARNWQSLQSGSCGKWSTPWTLDSGDGGIAQFPQLLLIDFVSVRFKLVILRVAILKLKRREADTFSYLMCMYIFKKSYCYTRVNSKLLFAWTIKAQNWGTPFILSWASKGSKISRGSYLSGSFTFWVGHILWGFVELLGGFSGVWWLLICSEKKFLPLIGWKVQQRALNPMKK